MSRPATTLWLLQPEDDEDVSDDPSVVMPFRVVMPESSLQPPAEHQARFRFDAAEGPEPRLLRPHPRTIPADR